MRIEHRGRQASRLRGIAAAVCAAMFLQAGCDTTPSIGSSGRVASDLACRAKGDRADLAWTPVAGATQYRIWRGPGVGSPSPGQLVPGTVFVDSGLVLGARYHWRIQALDAVGGEVATSNACEAVATADPGGPSGPPVVDDLVCRPKTDKVDLAWTPVAGALHYEIHRGASGAARTLVATTPRASFADIGLVSGAALDYSVRAVARSGVTSADSNVCTATPRPRDTTGTAPATPGGVVCRAKDGKTDLEWSAVAGAAFYRVSRSDGGTGGPIIGQTVRTVYADFGLANRQPYQYTVEAVGPTGLASAPSTACNVTPRNRDPAVSGNRAPGFTSTPTLTVREEFLWWYDAEASDPDGDPVSFELATGPAGATLAPDTGMISWTPTPAQIGDHAFEVFAHDGRGATGHQTFVLRVEDVNRPPQITSIPANTAKVGTEYLYTIDVFEPDGDPVTLDFDGPTPSGVSLDTAASVLRWTPTDPQIGPQSIRLRARDPGGAAAVQAIDVVVTRTPLDLLEPHGTFTMDLGAVLRIPVLANHPAARFSVRPLPQHGELDDGVFVFNPSPDQVGEILVSFEARLGEERDAEPVTIVVRKPNAAPALTIPPTASVDEGAPLRVPVSASDADGDVVTITAPGLSLPNAYFDQVTGELVFHPDFTQSGAYSVAFAASDGTATTNGTLDLTVVDATPTQPLDLVVDPPQTPTFVPTQTIRGSITGQTGGVAPPAALVTGLAPSGAKQGRSATVVLDVSNLTLADGATSADFGAGITVTLLEVLSPTQARATVAVATDAALGPRGVTLSSNGVDAPSIVAFLVEPGAAQITGTVIDPFTQQPLANARVKVNGSSVEATTDAQGNFVLDGVPAGAQQIVIAAPNYALQRLDVAVGANAALALPDPIGLDALARPYSAGGTLPRAARLASLVDRNVGTRNGGLTQQQAEDLVQDTLIVVGGNEMGVRDDTGNQLNPNAPPEASSVMPHAVRAQAQRLVEGHVLSLGEILTAIIMTFDWRGAQPTVGELLQDFQPIVDAAWARPGDPASAMPIVLFNQGTSLSSQAPLLTAETPINHFQAFLLCTSFLVKNRATLEESIDALLRAKGIDPDGIIADPTTIPQEVTQGTATDRQGLAVVAGALESALALLFGRDAFAASSQVYVDPNQFDRSFTGRTFTKIWENTKKAAWAEATYGGLYAAGTAAAGAILSGAIIGSPGGVAGVTLGATIGLALFDTAINILFQKIIVGLFLAATLQQLEPVPPLPSQAFIEGDKLIVQFSPSVTEQANQVTNQSGSVKGLGIKPEYLKYTYELLKFPDMTTTDFAQSKRIFGQLEPVPTKAGGAPSSQLQFVVSKAKALTPGPNYFRIVALQFISAAQVNDRVKWSFEYREDSNDPAFPGPSNLLTNLKVPPNPSSDAAVKLRQAHQFALIFNAKVIAITDANEFTLLEFKKKLEADANIRLAADQWRANDQRLRDWTIANQNELTQAKSAVQLADAPGKNPAGFLDEAAPEYKATAAALGDPSGKVPDEVALRQNEIATSRVEIDTQSSQVQAFEKNRDRFNLTLDQMKTANPSSQFSGVVNSFDAQGRPIQISFTVKPDVAGQAELVALLDAEETKIQNATAKIQAAEANITIQKEGIVVDRVGAAERTVELQLRDEDARLRAEAEKARVDADDAFKQAEIDRKRLQLEVDALDPTGAKTKESAKAPKFKPEKGVSDAISDGSAILSATTNVTDTVQQFLEGAQEMVSDLSPVLIFYDNPSPATAARPLARHPNLGEVDSFLTTKSINRLNPLPGQDVEVDGSFVTSFPGQDKLANTAGLGFPSDLLASDRQRWIYALNKRSSLYGGRIFRFDASNGYARELAGTVNYYSSGTFSTSPNSGFQSGRFGRPATPVAMAMAHGRNVQTGQIVDDLLVADIDFTTSPPQHRIVQVPVSFADIDPTTGQYRNPAYANGQFRDRIVGQPYAMHPSWNFLDIVEIVGGPEERSGGTQRHYLSNGSSVYVLKQDLQTGIVDPQILFDTPGRSWSGLAFDDAGNLYVADKTSGDVITLSEQERLALEATGASFCGNAIHLGTGAGNPVRIAVGQNNRTLVASTESNGVRVVGPLPVLLENAANYQAVALKGARHEYPTIKITQQNCPPMFLIEPSDIDLDNGRIKLRVQTRDPQTLKPAFLELNITLFPFGVTRVKTP